MSDSPLQKLDDDELDRTVETAMPSPDDTSPMLATLTDDTFDDPDWIFERKFDGERALAFCSSDGVDLRSRNHNSLNASYPEIADALEVRVEVPVVVDGEVVTFDGDVTSFQRLQQRMNVDDPDQARQSGVPVWIYLFDLLWIDGRDVTGLPLRTRKSLLRAAVDWDDPIRFTTHRNETGTAYLDEACEKGWEGVIAKNAESSYVHSRSKKWLKFKCVHQQELVIAGFTDPEGSRVGFGALLVGFYDGDELYYAGKVGTGYSDEFLEEFRADLDDIERDESPFDVGEPDANAHFVQPKYVGEFGFTEWTNDDKLRHPRFLGLRRDKKPHDVVKEEA